MQFNFISGLPRSGTTLLASILKQNPKIWSSFMTPLGQLVVDTQAAMANSETAMLIADAQRHNVLRALFVAFYAGCHEDVIVDNNRRWTAKLPLLVELFPKCKLFMCVRPPIEIAESMEKWVREHPLSASSIYGGATNITVYERTNILMKSDGLIGFALNASREAFYGNHRDHILLITYDNLTQYPALVLAEIHKQCGWEPFEYDFNKIEQLPAAVDFDRFIGTPDLHHLKERVVHQLQPSILPPDVAARMPRPFWVR